MWFRYGDNFEIKQIKVTSLELIPINDGCYRLLVDGYMCSKVNSKEEGLQLLREIQDEKILDREFIELKLEQIRGDK